MNPLKKQVRQAVKRRKKEMEVLEKLRQVLLRNPKFAEELHKLLKPQEGDASGAD
jgi:hypothetical protein